jgi:sarcosine oxidase subunit beta
MQPYSALSLLRNAVSGQRHWSRIWADRAPKKHYDVVIIGAGGHGLATAYYLARSHGVKNIAVLEKGYLGGGNSGRNTQVCRSNYFYPESAAFYDHSLQLYENLASELNFNIMLSQRGNLELSHSLEELEMNRRWATAMTLNGIDSEMLDRDDIGRLVPILDLDCRYPVMGGFIQKRAGIARHDAVVWAFARAASAAGVDIIQNCEVTAFKRNDSRLLGATTSRGEIEASRFALWSDRGEIVIGGGADSFNSYAQRGILPTMKDNAAAVTEMIPCFSRLRVMRQWAGICDLSPDSSPIVGKTEIENLYLSTGWGTGGYKAIPAGGSTLAHTIANDEPHALAQPFQLDRFRHGWLVDEGAAAGVAH